MMAGEENKMCWDQGDWPPCQVTVQDQWTQTLAQAASGIPRKDRKKELELINYIWELGLQKGKVPPLTARVNLVYVLSGMEREAKGALDQYRKDKKGGPLLQFFWRRKERQLENTRRLTHLMVMACVAVHRGYETEVEAIDVGKVPQRDPDPKPTPSLYPKLSSLNTPPPYQMPVVQITEGTVQYEDEGQRELVDALQRLTTQLAGREEGR